MAWVRARRDTTKRRDARNLSGGALPDRAICCALIVDLEPRLLEKPWNEAAAETAIAPLLTLEGPLLPMLHALQRAFGCVPSEATNFLALKLNLSRAEVHGVISFYHDFRRQPAGRVIVKLCRAEACQAMGAVAAAQALLKHLGIDWNETTDDGAITIAPTYCLGLCAVAPAALIGDTPAARLSARALIARVEALR